MQLSIKWNSTKKEHPNENQGYLLHASSKKPVFAQTLFQKTGVFAPFLLKKQAFSPDGRTRRLHLLTIDVFRYVEKGREQCGEGANWPLGVCVIWRVFCIFNFCVLGCNG